MSALWKVHRGTRARHDLILIALGVLLVTSLALPGESNASDGRQANEFIDHLVLLPGERILNGTVLEVAGGMVKVNTGDLEPRFLPIKGAIEKGIWILMKGDHVEIAVSAENLVVDYHPAGQPGWHRVVKGSLAQPLAVGYEWAVIRTEDGKEAAFAVRPLARLKVAAMPVGEPALFLVGEANKILDAAFGSDEDLLRYAQVWKRSTPKAPHRQLTGTIVKPPTWITIRTEDGQEQSYEVRAYVIESLAKIQRGGQVILLLDEENKVADAAYPLK